MDDMGRTVDSWDSLNCLAATLLNHSLYFILDKNVIKTTYTYPGRQKKAWVKCQIHIFTQNKAQTYDLNLFFTN